MNSEKANKSKFLRGKPMEDKVENVFQSVPMAVFRGYTKIGTIYPKGWTYNGVKLTEDLGVPSKPKYAKKLLKEMSK